MSAAVAKAAGQTRLFTFPVLYLTLFTLVFVLSSDIMSNIANELSAHSIAGLSRVACSYLGFRHKAKPSPQILGGGAQVMISCTRRINVEVLFVL